MQLTTATPAQIDEQLALIGAEIARHESTISRSDTSIARTQASRYFDPERDAEKLAAYAAQAQDALAEIKKLVVQAAPFHAEYDARGGWTRYYLVEGGHLHYDVSSHRCSRILTTSHYWITDQSGVSAEAVIELAGERVCTVCFPDAPVAVQERPSQLQTATEAEQAQERAARAEKRAQAAAAKAVKAITNPDGSELRVSTTYGVIKTERAAAIELVDCLWYEQFYGTDAERVVAIDTLLAALAAKRDTTVDEERTAAEVRLAARIKREG